jgi:hypothetical protein
MRYSLEHSLFLNLIQVLSITRIATGLACLITPHFTCAQHHYSLPGEHGPYA